MMVTRVSLVLAAVVAVAVLQGADGYGVFLEPPIANNYTFKGPFIIAPHTSIT